MMTFVTATGAATVTVRVPDAELITMYEGRGPPPTRVAL